MKHPGVSIAALFTVLLLVCFLPHLSAAQGEYDDVVYLKNGGIIRGVITEQVPGVSLKIESRDGKIAVDAMEDVRNLTREEATQEQATASVDEKSPGLAFALSFILPGGGQYYNGEVVKGVIMTGLFGAGIAVALALGYEDVFTADEYYWASYGYWTEEETAWLYVGFGIAAGAWIWSFIDAPISASDINDQRARSYGHLFEWGTSLGTAGFDLGAVRGGIGARFTVHL